MINYVFDIALSTVLDFYFKAPDNSAICLCADISAEFGYTGVEDVGLLFSTSYINNPSCHFGGSNANISDNRLLFPDCDFSLEVQA